MFFMLQEMELSSSKLKKLVIFQEGTLKTNQKYALKKFLDLLTFLQFYSSKVWGNSLGKFSQEI